MKKYHSGAGKSHHDPDLFAVVRPVTVDRAFFARRFVFTEFATLQPPISIVFQLLAILTQRLALPMFETAIDAQHLGNRLFLAIVHRINRIKY